MQARVAFVIFYFGRFPNYFPVFLRSCGHNPDYDWHIYTDNPKEGVWPENVICHRLTFSECQAWFQSKFEYPICLDTPKKLCDLKPLYGFILQEELGGYDFWGHCDLDQIFGKIDLNFDELGVYDKLYTLGHFTVYKNTPEVSRVLLDYRNGARVKEVFTTKQMVALDEWGPENVNDIFIKAKRPFLQETYGSDIWPERRVFSLGVYDRQRNRYRREPDSEGILFYDRGRLFYVNKDGSFEETGYVHLQKRELRLFGDVAGEQFLILPEGFYFLSRSVDRNGKGFDGWLRKYVKRGLKKPVFFDRQFWKIKGINLKRRLER